MKKMTKLLLLLVAVSVVCVLSLGIFASAANASVSVDKVEAKLNAETVTVKITLNCTDKIQSYGIGQITYDTTNFELQSAKWTNVTSSAAPALSSDYDGQTAVLGYAAADNCNGTVLTVVLKLKSTAVVGTTSVSCTAIVDNASASVSAGSVKLSCASHSFGDTYTKISDTQHSRTCSVCGVEEKKDHSWDKGTVTKPASCKEVGNTHYVCTASGCGAEKDVAIDKTNDHKYGAWETEKKATCTAEGKDVRVCSVCQNKDTRTLKKLGHDFKAPVVEKEATLTQEGLTKGECSRCGETTSQKIPCKAEDAEQKVSVETSQGAFKEGTTMAVSPVEQGSDSYLAAANVFTKGQKIEGWSIAFEKDGANVAPEKEVTFTVPAPAFEVLKVYRVAADGKLSEVTITAQDDNSITFKSLLAGDFILVSEEGEGPADPTDPDEDPTVEPDTTPDVNVVPDATTENAGDTTEDKKTSITAEEDKDSSSLLVGVIIIVVVVLAGVAVCFWYFMKKK